MPGFGFGYGPAARRRRRHTSGGNASTLPVLRPSGAWTGAPGSGFATLPADPVRTTAKPALRLLVPPNQFYTSELLVGVIGGANDNGSMLRNLGLAGVVLHYEGNSIMLAEPTMQDVVDANGVTRSYMGWWAKLGSDGRHGHGHVYFEAIPLASAMQRRVIGPYQFSPAPALHDHAVDVDPAQPVVAGQRYQSIAAALQYLASASADNPLITLKGGGTFDIGQGPSATYQGQGYCTIRAEQPAVIARTGYTSDAAALVRPRYDGLRFTGDNLTIDGRFIQTIYQENNSGRQHWLDGIRLINSGGRADLWRGGTRRISQFVRNTPWFTECTSDGLPDVANAASLVRGCDLRNGFSDVLSDAACVVHTRTSDWDSSLWLEEKPAMTVIYGGPEATATLELSGGNDASLRTFTARWGANSATFSVGSTDAMRGAGTYTVGQVAAWLNGLGVGFTATVQDDTRRASACSVAGAKGDAFTARNVKGTALQIVTMFDLHSDWYQQNLAKMPENCVIANNIATGLVAQDIFLTASDGARDFMVFNNAFENKRLSGTYNNYLNINSQLAATHSHVVLAHNSFASQGLGLRGTMGYAPDAYCLIASNSFRDIGWDGTQSAAVRIADNHLQDGAAGANIGTGTFVSGSSEQVFRASAAENFAVRGALRNIRRTPVVPLDRAGMARASTDASGSEAIAPLPVPVPASETFGSVQFPAFNRHFPGRAGHIAYPKTGIADQPLLRFDAAGAFFIMLQIPHERTKVNREARIIGNAISSGSQTFSLVHYGDEYWDTTRHDEIRWRCRGSSGDLIDLSVDVQTRASQWQLIVVSCNGQGSYAINSYSARSARISGSTQTSANAQIDSLTGTHVLLGDIGTTAGALDVLVGNVGAFGGAVAFHGFVRGTAGSDAQWQAIAEGADIRSTLAGASGFRLLRDYRGKAAIGAATGPVAADDPTLAGSIHGSVSAGGTMQQAPQVYLAFKRLPDGYVICPRDGETTGSVTLQGNSAGLSGALCARVLSPDGATLVEPFAFEGVGPTMNVSLPLPEFAGWGIIELWSESHPDIVFRMNSRIGCGHKVSVIGQSQCDIMLYASGVTTAPSGIASFCGYIGLRSDPADTTSVPVKRFSTSARPQMFVIEPEMTNVYNGVTAIASRIHQHGQGKAVCVIDTCIPGTSARDWIKDSVTTRLWALDVEIAALAGTDRVPVWQWYTSDAGSYPDLLDAVVHGTGPLAGDRRLFDGSINAPGYKLGICLPTRATNVTAGPTTADDFGTTRSTAQAGQLAWAAANPAISAVGPAVTDFAIDNLAAGTPSGPNANLGGPHGSQVLMEGCFRLGYRIGETYLRARGLSPTAGNPALRRESVVVAPDRSTVTISASLPNGGSLRTQDSRPVNGFEYSLDSGTTWSRLGITATITAPGTVTLALDSGPWPVGARFAYLRGGPFSHGTSVELSAPYKGGLYDGCEAENGLGFPVMAIPAAEAIIV